MLSGEWTDGAFPVLAPFGPQRKGYLWQAAIVRVLLKASMTRGGLVQAKICDLSTPWPSRPR
jgi:hypothetical protein